MKKLLSLLLTISLVIGCLIVPKTITAKTDSLKPTWNNIYWLAKTMYAENSSGTDETVILTGIVVCQRVRADIYQDSIYGVISQRGQYSTWTDGSIESCEQDERCLEIAEEILRFKLYKKYPHNLVFQSQFPQGIKTYKYISKDHEYFCLS